MWTPGPLLLLLASHCVLSGTSIQRSLSVEEEYLEDEKTEKEMVRRFKWLKDNAKQILEITGTALGGIEKAGGPLNAVLQAAAMLIPEADKIDGLRTEMNALNARWDFLNEDLKWASRHYQLALDNIERSWLKYSMTENKEVVENIFFPFYTEYVNSVLVLHRLLTLKTDANSLGDVLAKRLRCHDKELEEHFSYLNTLVCQGNRMDEKYYEFKKMKTDRKSVSVEIANKSASALFTSHQRCVSNSALYIKRDIIERIDDTKEHQQIANNIGAFLRKTYNRYEWVVIAFTTHFSQGLPNVLKRHVLSGFTEIERGTVTVAYAKQIKGKYTKAKNLKDEIQKCLKDVPCNALQRKILDCPIVSEAYTALHIFKNHNQTYVSRYEKDDKDTYSESFADMEGIQKDHIYNGECPLFNPKYAKKTEKGAVLAKIKYGSSKLGHFIGASLSKAKKNIFGEKFLSKLDNRKFFILIKSDEELNEKYKPCSTLTCKNGGTCVVAPRTNIPLCKCLYPYYGKNCESTITC